MKLLTLFPSHIKGGAEAYALTIASAAKQGGWDVHAGFPEASGTVSLIQEFLLADVKYHRLQVPSVPGSKVDAIKSNFFYFKETIALVRKLQPDVVHISVPGLDHSLIALVACAVLNTPSVTTFHLISSQRKFSGYRRRIYTWAKSRNQQWIAVSQYIKVQLSEILQLPLESIQVIPNGIKCNLITKSISSDKSRLRCQLLQELHLPETSQIAITVGRLSPQKGYHDLLEVIPELMQFFPNLKFIWAGEGEQREALEQRIQALNLVNTVLLLGQRSDINNLLQAADLFIFPTYFEGLPFALLEAMACGLPIVASNSTSIPEIIKHKEHGYLFPVGDRSALLAAIYWMLTHPKQAQEMAIAAQVKSQEFTEEKMAKSTIDTLRNVCLRTISK